jgi:hypothetical protein
VQDFPARYAPQMGFEGANVLFDTWVHPLMMGLEEHLLGMFREDFEFHDAAAASHLGHGSSRPQPPQPESPIAVSEAAAVGMATSLPVGQTTPGEAVWAGAMRWVMAGLSVLGSVLLGITGTLGGHLVGDGRLGHHALVEGRLLAAAAGAPLQLRPLVRGHLPRVLPAGTRQAALLRRVQLPKRRRSVRAVLLPERLRVMRDP